MATYSFRFSRKPHSAFPLKAQSLQAAKRECTAKYLYMLRPSDFLHIIDRDCQILATKSPLLSGWMQY